MGINHNKLGKINNKITILISDLKKWMLHSPPSIRMGECLHFLSIYYNPIRFLSTPIKFSVEHISIFLSRWILGCSIFIWSFHLYCWLFCYFFSSQFQIWIIFDLVCLCVMWSCCFVLIKKGLHTSVPHKKWDENSKCQRQNIRLDLLAGSCKHYTRC